MLCSVVLFPPPIVLQPCPRPHTAPCLSPHTTARTSTSVFPPTQGPEEGEETYTREMMQGAPKGEEAQWASCIRLVDAATGETTHVRELTNSEACVSMCLVTFAGREAEGPLLALGCSRSMTFQPMGSEGGVIHLFRLGHEGASLELLHSTDVKEDVVGALCQYQGRLLAGCGPKLRLYDLGKRKLLRKCEYRSLPTLVRDLKVVGDRIYAADGQVRPGDGATLLSCPLPAARHGQATWCRRCCVCAWQINGWRRYSGPAHAATSRGANAVWVWHGFGSWTAGSVGEQSCVSCGCRSRCTWCATARQTTCFTYLRTTLSPNT